MKLMRDGKSLKLREFRFSACVHLKTITTISGKKQFSSYAEKVQNTLHFAIGYFAVTSGMPILVIYLMHWPVTIFVDK